MKNLPIEIFFPCTDITWGRVDTKCKGLAVSGSHPEYEFTVSCNYSFLSSTILGLIKGGKSVQNKYRQNLIVSALVRTDLENHVQFQNNSVRRRWTSQDSKPEFI